MKSKVHEVSAALRAVATEEKAAASQWFFKTGPGQYGEGDKFLGVTVPEQRKIAKQFRDLSYAELDLLLLSPWHEERLTGLLILVDQFRRGDETKKQAVYNFYLDHAACINNWDLVDSSASYIVGAWLQNRPEKMKVLRALAVSPLLWERRIAMISTLHNISAGQSEEAFEVATILIDDNHDLIQKAVGWMLREAGKRVSRAQLLEFLDVHAATMPRTMLRYAIEHLSAEQRKHYLGLKRSAAA